MAIPGVDTVARFQENEDRFDKFLNDPSHYVNKNGNPVESLPHLVDTVAGMTLTSIFTGNWVTSHVYNRNEISKINGVNYICKIAHTSGVFATDLASGKWILFNEVLLNDLIFDIGSVAVERYGADPTGTNECLAAFINAYAAGVTCLRATGVYKVNGSIAVPDSCGLIGIGSKSIINQMSSSLPTIILNTARSYVRDIRLKGPNVSSPYVGKGIQIGDPTVADSASGIYELSNVRVFNFNEPLVLAGALWTSFYNCWFEANTYGLIFDGASGTYTTSCYMYSCTIRGNDRNAILGLNVPIRNMGLNLINCNIENNGGENTAIYAQIKTGPMELFSIQNSYIESTLSTFPDALDLSYCGDCDIKTTLFNGAKRGIFSTTAVNNASIRTNRFRNITNGQNAIELPDSGNAGIFTYQNESNHVDGSVAPFSIAGASSAVITGKLTNTGAQDVVFPSLPVLAGGTTPGTPVYTIQTGRYSEIGDQIFFRLRISISSLGGATGVVLIKNMPKLSANSPTSYSVVAVSGNGITLSGSNTFYNGIISPNSSQIEIMQDGSATGGVNLQCSQLAASTTLIISGNYTFTP